MSVFSQLMMKKIPIEYKVLDWIQSSGTQYIDTGIVPTSTTRVVTEIEVSTTTQDIPVFGCKDVNAGQSTNSRYYHLTPNSNKWYFGTNNAQSNAGTYDNVVGTSYQIDFNNNREIIINSTSIASSIGAIGNGTLCISARIGPSARYGQFKYRSFTIYDNTSLRENLIPVRRLTDNEVGMYDTVSKTFVTNAGTGSFIGSDEMPLTVVGSPTIQDGVVSGFSASDYLNCDGASAISSANTWEICLQLKNGSGSYFIGSNKQYAITISRGTSKIYLSSDGTTWDIASGVGLGTALPTDCYVRLKFTGTQYIADYSTDKINWINFATIDSSVKITTIDYLKIGSWTGASNYTGSIDFNNSYIVLDGTKYLFVLP